MDISLTLQKIAASGMSDAEIGVAVGAPQSIITRLRNGTHKTTSYERGKLIHDLAEKVGADSTASHEANVSAASSGCKKLNLEQMNEAA